MTDFGLTNEGDKVALPIHLVPVSGLDSWLAAQDALVRAWVEGGSGKPEAGQTVRLPAADGGTVGVLRVADDKPDMWAIAGLRAALWDADFALDLSAMPEADVTGLCLGWALGGYIFDRYKKPRKQVSARLVWPEGADRELVSAQAGGIVLARDLINTPADDLGPSELEAAARTMAEGFGGAVSVTVGEDLLAQNFPMIHAVGRASDDPPRLIDLTFGDPSHPKLTLVGKGVCFDTGGLDMKSAAGMDLMRKDMGGAATALGLAHTLLSLKVPVRLRVLLPTVENAVAGNAYRPGDILQTRKGLTVEIGNTDAEGRLVLGDALALASEEEPELLIDFATLTGAARVAVGTEIAAFFTASDALGDEAVKAGRAAAETVWRLPLHDDYRHMLDTPFADINNAGTGGFGGATTAALFLKEFVAKPDQWLHFDIMGWNARPRPGRPKGGEAMGLRAMCRLIQDRFG